MLLQPDEVVVIINNDRKGTKTSYDDKEGTTITNQLSKDLGHLAIRGLVSGPAMIIALSSIPSESPCVRMMISRKTSVT